MFAQIARKKRENGRFPPKNRNIFQRLGIPSKDVGRKRENHSQGFLVLVLVLVEEPFSAGGKRRYGHE